MTDQFDQLLEALESERRYVARELHDSVAQTTLQLGLQAGICRKLMEIGKMDMLASELAQLEERIKLVSSQVREMISDMRPPVVEPNATLNDHIQYATDIHTQRGGPPIAYTFDWPDGAVTFSQVMIVTLVRIIQEALFNIRKHAQAQNVSLTLFIEHGVPCVTITDDGKGFNVPELEARPVNRGGAGVTNMRIRAKAIGGTLSVTSDPTQGGTEITLKLPQ